MKIIQCSLYLMLIAIGISYADNEISIFPDDGFGAMGPPPVKLRKLTIQENEERLDNCGKPPGKKLERSAGWWFGTLNNVSTTYYATEMLSVLISPYHAIFSHTVVFYKNTFEYGNCDNKVPVIFKSHERVGFSESTATPVKQFVFYGTCDENGEPNSGFVIAEFEKPVDLPYACFPVAESYLPDVGPLVLPSRLSNKRLYFDEPQPGKIVDCEGPSICWQLDKDNQTYWRIKMNVNGNPLMLMNSDKTNKTAVRPMVMALSTEYNSNTTLFKIFLLKDHLEEVCNLIGVCDRTPPTTTTTTTTTTTQTTTTTTVTTTTEYIPMMVGDPEMMDFEIPYKRRIKDNGGGVSKKIIFVVFVVSILVFWN